MDDLVKNGLVFELGGGKDGLMYPASGDSPALVLDASGNGNNGVNSGAVLSDGDTVLSFDGVDDYISLSTISALSVANNFTIVVKFKLNNAASIQAIFVQALTASDQVAIIQNNNSLRLGYYNGTSTVNKSITLSNTSNYHFVVLRVNAGVVTATLDGVAMNGTDTLALPSGILGLNIGRRFDRYYLNGFIDFINAYSRVLSDGEITTISNGGTVADGLVLDMPMNRLNCRTNSGIDTAGNNTVTNNGATLTADHNGRANRGWQCTSSESDYIISDTDITVGNVFSIAIAVDYSLNSTNFVIRQDASNFVNILWNTNLLPTIIIVQDGVTRAQYRGQFASAPIWNGYHYLSFSVNLNINEKIVFHGGNFASTFPIDIYDSAFTADIVGKAIVGRRVDLGAFVTRKTDNIKVFNNRFLTESEHLKLFNYWRSH